MLGLGRLELDRLRGARDAAPDVHGQPRGGGQGYQLDQLPHDADAVAGGGHEAVHEQEGLNEGACGCAAGQAGKRGTRGLALPITTG